MNRLVAITGMAVLGASLIGWAALAWAQPSLGKRVPANDPAEAIGAESVGGSAPFAASPPKAASPVPATGVPGVRPMPSALGVGTPLPSGMAPIPPAGRTPSIMPFGPMSSRGPADALPTGPAPIGPMAPATGPSKPAPLDPGLATEGPSKLPAMPPAAVNPVGPGSSLPPLGGATEPSGLRESNAASTLPPDEPSPDSTVTPDNTTGRQEPAISLEWIGSPTAKVGQPGTYGLLVRNACNIPVQQVLVRVRVPEGLTCSDTEPKAVAEKNVLVWELGTLQAKQEKNLQMKLLAEQKGDVSPQAWVTFTGSSVMRIKVREPKLALKAQGPQKVLVGETATFVLSVTNPGDGAAEQVKIHAVLSEGLESPRGPKMDFDVGNLAPGETRNVSVQCISKSGGVQKCEAMAEADGGLHAKEAVSVSVTMPRLDLQVIGPGLRYLGRKAVYTLKVTNPGDAPASNVTISDLVPEGFKVLAASEGGRHDFTTRTVSWFLGEVGAGQSHEVKLEVQAINPGEFKHKASAVGGRGLCAESELTTRVEGLSALMLEMVDTEDPIEVNSETAYEVRITNTGSKVETDIKLVASIPDKMEFKNSTGPVRFHEEGKTIVFDPIEKLAPKADAIFRINVKALDAGTVRFKIQMTSTNLTEPVIKMEATRIYSDAPEVKSSHN
jgi:uncharacterized repeat protein (TIGR01451 family)